MNKNRWTPVEYWCWYIALCLIALALIAPSNLPFWFRVPMCVWVAWMTRIFQIDTRRQARLARRAGVR